VNREGAEVTSAGRWQKVTYRSALVDIFHHIRHVAARVKKLV